MSKNKLSKFKKQKSREIPLRKLDNTRDTYWNKVADEFLKPSKDNPSLDRIFNIYK